ADRLDPHAPGRTDRRRAQRPHRLLAQRHRPAAGPRHLPPHRPGDDRAAPAEGAEARMTIAHVLPQVSTGFLAAEGGDEGGSNIEIGVHVERHWPIVGTVNIDTISSTVIAALIVLVLGFWLRSQLTKS